MQPIAVVLCPGWERAQVVYDLLEETKVSQVLHQVVVLLGVGKNEAKAAKIPQNCKHYVIPSWWWSLGTFTKHSWDLKKFWV